MPNAFNVGKAKSTVTASSSFSLGPNLLDPANNKPPIEIPRGIKWETPITPVKAAPGAIPKGGGEKALVTYVPDGDGAQLTRGDGSSINCRIDNIDAPETAKPQHGKAGQPFGEDAKRTLQSMIENKEVTLRVTRPAITGKNYDRALCQIEIEGKNISQEMIRQGAAWLYANYSNDPVLRKTEQEARSAGIGLWKESNPERPSDFRKRISR